MLPLQITFRDIELSPALESHIRKKTEKLQRFYNRIIDCHVIVEFAQKNQHQGKLYNVRITTKVPGKELVVTRKYDQDIYIALREAFQAMSRQLEEHARKRHGRIKTHQNIEHGFVTRILAHEGYGFIQGMDGNEYYFSVTNVHYPNFHHLNVGDAVEFTGEAVDEGWQAYHIIKERHNHVHDAAHA